MPRIAAPCAETPRDSCGAHQAGAGRALPPQCPWDSAPVPWHHTCAFSRAGAPLPAPLSSALFYMPGVAAQADEATWSQAALSPFTCPLVPRLRDFRLWKSQKVLQGTRHPAQVERGFRAPAPLSCTVPLSPTCHAPTPAGRTGTKRGCSQFKAQTSGEGEGPKALPLAALCGSPRPS